MGQGTYYETPYLQQAHTVMVLSATVACHYILKYTVITAPKIPSPHIVFPYTYTSHVL